MYVLEFQIKCDREKYNILARQWLLEKTGSDVIDTTAIPGGSDRSCVGLQRSDKAWSFKAFSCSSPPASNTGYVCEYSKYFFKIRQLNMTIHKAFFSIILHNEYMISMSKKYFF
jgi:hypothetical protein